MLETASREIREAAEADERRRLEARRLLAPAAALDDLLFELEELNPRGIAVAPASCGYRGPASSPGCCGWTHRRGGRAPRRS